MQHVVSNGEYAGRLPSPPHTAIPPPLTVYTEAKAWSPDSMPDYLKPYGWTLQKDLDTRQSEMFAWNYEDRRRAQSVVPFIALGPIVAAKNATYLQEAGITMLLAIHQQQLSEARTMSAAANVAQGLGIEIQQIDVTNLQKLRSVLSLAVLSMANHLAAAPKRFNKLGKVLVTCETGNERSAAVVAAFLVEVVGLDLVNAVQVVQSRRFSVNIDDELKTILSSFCDILEAQKMVKSATQHTENISTTINLPWKPSKRGRAEEDEAIDVDMMLLDDDEQRFAGRTFTPFKDK